MEEVEEDGQRRWVRGGKREGKRWRGKGSEVKGREWERTVGKGKPAVYITNLKFLIRPCLCSAVYHA